MAKLDVEDIVGKNLTQLDSFGTLSKSGTNYKLSGEENQPLVVLVHGVGGVSFVFEPLETALNNSGYQVLRYDLGWSQKGQRYTLNEHVHQLEELMNELNLASKRCFIIAHSMGGVIATAYAVAHYQMVRGCCLLSPAGAMDSPIPGFGCLQCVATSLSCCCIPCLAHCVQWSSSP